ncbi:MAG TPA: HPr family phosphocarrier protein [Armatimonadota bacterium]
MQSEKTVTMHPDFSLHARPAARFVQLAKSFDAKVTVKKDERSADARSAIALMGLDAGNGATITICADGAQAAEAVEALAALVVEKP